MMVDIETLGSDTESAAVISVAAVRFDIDTGDIDEEGAFYHNIMLKDALSYGDVSADTLKWWLADKSRRQVFLDIIYDKEAVKTVTVLNSLNTWARNVKATVPWSKGIDFDFGILDRLYRQTDAQTPFSQFWRRRDLRTLIDVTKMAGVPALDVPRNEAQGHNALADVVHQAREAFYYTRAMRELTATE